MIQSRCVRLCVLAWAVVGTSVLHAAQVVSLTGGNTSRTFEGVGAVSGGGATSVLLKDYPKAQQDQILDILFKPNFAASIQTLYVEIGGDCNSTQGTEPTHMRSRKDENYFRGYEWWLMREAKQRNPSLTLDACAWGCPGWIGDGNFWSQDMCDYYVKWIKGLRDVHGLELDAIGCRNERGDVTSWIKLFRTTLDREGLQKVRIHGFDNPGNKNMWKWTEEAEKNAELAKAVGVFGNHTLALVPPDQTFLDRADRLNKPIWNTEEHVYDGEGRKYADEFACAIGAVNLFNVNFIDHHATKIVNWYLVGSTYGIEPYADQPPALIAREPWSGHYRVKPIIWAYAHYGQFVKLGWKYLENGCTRLADGGTMVTLSSADGSELSVIAETAQAKGMQEVTLEVNKRFEGKKLCVWKSTPAQQFVQLDDVEVKNGRIVMSFESNAIYSSSTKRGQIKGEFKDIPASTPFPMPYADNFEGYGDAKSWGYLPHYMADICGVFELTDRPDGKGKCMKQMVRQKANTWAPEWMPYTIIGDAAWSDYEISADVFLDDGGWAGVMGRINQTGNGWDGNPAGYYARVYPDGGVAIYRADPKIKGSRDRQLVVGAVDNWKWNTWKNVCLRFEGAKISLLVDGLIIATTEDTEFGKGMAGLITAGEGNARHTALFDNLKINAPGKSAVAIPPTSVKRVPMYSK